MKIKYTIVFEGEMEVSNNINKYEEVIDEIRREFYECGFDANEAQTIDWEAIG